MSPRVTYANVVLFLLQADPPQHEKIPEEDIIGVTVLLLTCSYLGQEFLRVGYYVSNEYVDEQLREEPPAKVQIDKVQRNILADKPRVTKFPIVFNSPAAAVAAPSAPFQHQAPATFAQQLEAPFAQQSLASMPFGQQVPAAFPSQPPPTFAQQVSP